MNRCECGDDCAKFEPEHAADSLPLVRNAEGVFDARATALAAYARGVAAGRAAENEACEKQLRKQASEHESIATRFPDIAEPQMIRANCLNTEADAIAARRGRGA